MLIFVRMAAIPNSKIELHQWANSILLGIVGFFVIQTYTTIQTDHDKLATHETRISLLEDWRRGSSQSSLANEKVEAVLPEKIKIKQQ